MTIRLLDLPPAVTEGGYVYALAFSNGAIKVGKTKSPGKRIASHVCTASKFGVDVADVWISAAHPAYSDTERVLIAMAGTLAGDPGALDSRVEDFTGVDFTQLVGICRQLGLDESTPTSRPSEPQESPARRSNVVRLRPRATPREPRPLDADQRGAAFANLVIAARSRAGLTQEGVEEKSGVSRATLSRWERGQVERPEADHIRSLCRVIGLDPVDAVVALGYLEAGEVAGRVSA